MSHTVLADRSCRSPIMQASAEQVRHTAVFAITAWLCLCHLPVAVCWSCSLTMTGSHDSPGNLSLAQTSLHCTPEEGDVGTALPVGFSDKLSSRSLQGRRPDLSFVAKDVSAAGPWGAASRCSVLVARSLLMISVNASQRGHPLNDCRCASAKTSCWAQRHATVLPAS